MKRAILIAALAALAGCASFFQPAAEEAARAIVKYCEQSPLQERELLRNTIQAELPEGYAVQVSCPGDPE